MKQHENTPIRTYMSCHGTVQLRDSLKFITSITPKIPLYHSTKAPISYVVHAVTPPSLSHHHHHHISQCSQALACFPHTHGASWFPRPAPLLPPPFTDQYTDRSECAHISPASDSSLLLRKSHAKAYKSDYNSHRPHTHGG